MQALILEDEHLLAQSLSRLLKEVAPEIELLGTLSSLAEARAWFAGNNQPDLLFADIQLGDGVSFTLFEEMALSCPVIFTTAYDEFAIRAFKLNSIDYLLKPVNKDELKAAIEKYKRLQGPAPKADLESLLQFLQPSQRHLHRVMAHRGKSIVPIPVDDILLIYLDELIFIATKGEEALHTDWQTLEEAEAGLPPEKFFRANRQQIIALDAVESYKQDYSGKITLKLISLKLPDVRISREKAPAFKSWLRGE